MQYIEITQGTDEWHKLRLGRVTASRFKDVVAIGAKGQYLAARDSYKKELVAQRLIGVLGEKKVFVTDAMQWGHMNEEIARTTYQLQTGRKVTAGGIILHDTLPVAVSTDGFVDTDGTLEVKSPEPHNYLYNIVLPGQYIDPETQVATQELPDDYKAQVQGQLWVSERKWCDFIGSDSRMPAGLDLYAVRVERDDDYIAFLEHETELFIKEVDRDFYHFLEYLPVCERVCRTCGLVFTDKVAVCPECKINSTEVIKVLEPAKQKLINSALSK